MNHELQYRPFNAQYIICKVPVFGEKVMLKSSQEKGQSNKFILIMIFTMIMAITMSQFLLATSKAFIKINLGYKWKYIDKVVSFFYTYF